MEKDNPQTNDGLVKVVEGALNTLNPTSRSKNVIPILFTAVHGCYASHRNNESRNLEIHQFNTPHDMNIVKLNAAPLSVVSNCSQVSNDHDVVACNLVSYMDNPDDTRSLSNLLNDVIGNLHQFHNETDYREFKGYEKFEEPFKRHHENDNMFSYSELPGNSVMYNKYYDINLKLPTFDESKTNEENDKEFDEWYNTSDLRWRHGSAYIRRLNFFKPGEEDIPYDEGFEGNQGVRRGRDILDDVRRYISEKTGVKLEDISGVYLSRVIDFLYNKENIRDLLIVDTSCSVIDSTAEEDWANGKKYRYIIDNAEKDAEDIGRINENNIENRIKVSARGTETPGGPPPIDPNQNFLGKYGGKRTKKNRRTKRRKSKKPTRRRKPTRKIRKNKK